LFLFYFQKKTKREVQTIRGQWLLVASWVSFSGWTTTRLLILIAMVTRNIILIHC
jgi:hypothetical protein